MQGGIGIRRYGMLRTVIVTGFFLVMVVWLQTTFTHAAPADWQAWLYEPDTGQLVHINQRGRVLETHFIAQNIADLAITPDGDRLAYTLPAEHRLNIVSLQTGDLDAWFLLPVPDAGLLHSDDRLQLSPRAFSGDGALLAFAYTIAANGWTIVILDAETADIRYQLTHDAPIVAPYRTLHPGLLPQVQGVYDDTVWFTAPNDATNPLYHHKSYQWHFRDGTLSETRALPTFDGALWLPRAETVNPAIDDRFPMSNPDIPHTMPQRNSLWVYEGQRALAFPFFTDETFDFQAVRFVQSGQRILAEAYVDALNTWWVTLDRSGRVLRRQRAAGSDVQGVPNGFIYMTRLDEKAVVVHVDTEDMVSAGETVWVDDGQWRIIWATTGQADVSGWTRLAMPINDPDPLDMQAVPTILPTARALRYIGFEGQLQTLEDDYLNLRDAPSTNSNVLALLENGVRFTLIDGPIEAEGFTWWQVRVAGRTGWIVESLPDLLTIIPRQPTPEPSATP